MSDKKKKFSFDVNRRIWGEGGLVVESHHHDRGDTYCVLGFLAREIGVTKKELVDHGAATPADVARISPKYAKKLGDLGLLTCDNGTISSSDIADEIMSANDDGVTQSDTEKRLKKLFAKLDIKVNFVNKFPKKVLAEKEY